MSLGFTNPWMLAGLAAVAIPVVIHLLTRARPRRVPFPPYRFLVEACAGRQAVHRLRTWLLLALRTLAVLALVLLFSRPFLKERGAADESLASRRMVVIVDASLSMRAAQGGVSLFAQAQAGAAELLRGFESGGEAAVILAGASPRPLLPALSRNVPALHEALVRSEATFERGNPAAALGLARRMLGEEGGTVHVFSDFQRSEWGAMGAVPAGMICRLRPVGDGHVENSAVTGVRLSPAEPVVGESSEVVVTVFNGTARPRHETVRIELGGISQERQVSIPPFNSGGAAFNIRFDRPGHFIGRTWIQPDDLREDDTRHIAVRVREALQVLLVSDGDAGDWRTGAFFLSRALAPSAESAPGVAVVARHSQDVDRGILETADVFVIGAPALLTGETIEVIGRRVKEGARLMVFLDGAGSELLVPATFAAPFRLLGPVVSEGGGGLLPGLRPVFAEGESADWASLRFNRRLQNRLLEGREEEALLFHEDGSAALTLTRTEKGAVVFVNMPLTPDGGDLVGSPIFPALVHELLRVSRRGDALDVTPGTVWTLEASAGPGGGAAPVVLDPDGNAVETQVISSGRVMRLAPAPPVLPGVYLVRHGEELAGMGVVNVDSRESDTRAIALELLAEEAGGLVSVARGEGDYLLEGETRPLWPLLAAMAVLFLGLEMVLLAFWRSSRALTHPVAVVAGGRPAVRERAGEEMAA